MDFNVLVHSFIDGLVEVSKAWHFPVMISAFIFGVALRILVYSSVKRHEWFAREFHKRVGRFLDGEAKGAVEPLSFYVATKKLLEKTFFEVFENRDKFQRRKPDHVMAMSDRVFLVKAGCAWLIKDVLKQIRHLKYGTQPPKLIAITKTTFASNPCFNRVFGVIPTVTTNEILNILPGLFVIGGIFGTFLGVMKGLPELSGMDIQDPEKTKLVMDRFLVEIAMSMGASLIGIFFSVLMTIVNTIFTPERLFVDIVDRFENSLDLLWNRSTNNEMPSNLKSFDEHRDPREALAENAIDAELAKQKKDRSSSDAPDTKAS
ncbi:MAG: hypothetical protein AB7O96_14960 [Pseudobdellovibrionaceae bacterium]